MEAVGGAIASKVNSDKTNYNVEFAIDWSIVVFSRIWVIPFVWKIQDVPAHAGQETEYVKDANAVWMVHELHHDDFFVYSIAMLLCLGCTGVE